MAECCAEGRITDIRDASMEEKSGKYGRMEATFQGGQGPERSVVPWMDGWMDGGLTMIYYIPKSLFFFGLSQRGLTSKKLRCGSRLCFRVHVRVTKQAGGPLTASYSQLMGSVRLFHGAFPLPSSRASQLVVTGCPGGFRVSLL